MLVVLEITCEYNLLMLWCIAGNPAESDGHSSCPSFGIPGEDHWAHLQTQEEKTATGSSPGTQLCLHTSKNKFSDHWLTCVTHLKDRKVRNRLNKKHNPTQLQWSWDKNFGVMAPWPANVFGWFLQCRIGFFSLFFLWVISNGSKDPVDQAPNLAFIWDNFWRS